MRKLPSPSPPSLPSSRLDLLPDYEVREALLTLGLLHRERLSPVEVTASLRELGYSANPYQLQTLFGRALVTPKSFRSWVQKHKAFFM